MTTIVLEKPRSAKSKDEESGGLGCDELAHLTSSCCFVGSGYGCHWKKLQVNGCQHSRWLH